MLELYDILEPMSDIYGVDESVRSPSRSLTGTLQGDIVNSGSESPVRDEDRSLDRRNDESQLVLHVFQLLATPTSVRLTGQTKETLLHPSASLLPMRISSQLSFMRTRRGVRAWEHTILSCPPKTRTTESNTQNK